MIGLLPVSGKSQTQFIQDDVEIKTIRFSGNENFRTSELRNQLTIHSRFLQRWIRRGSPYNARQIMREQQVIANYYRQSGFLDVTLRDSITQLETDAISIEFIINEGKQYYLRHYTISGNQQIPLDRYIDELKLQPNIPFSRYEIQTGLQQIVRAYETIGYPSVVINDSVAIGDSIDLFINVHEGDLTTIRNIIFPTVTGVREHEIKREVVIHSGDTYNIELIEESQRRLFETGLFNGVSILPTRLDTTGHTVDLNIQLMVAKFRAVDFELGLKQAAILEYVDPVLNLQSSGSWQHKNIDQTGRKFQIKLTASTRFPEIYIPQQFRGDLIYTEPWLFNFRTPTSINPYYQYLDWSEIYGAGAFKWEYGVQITTLYRWFRTVQGRGQLEWSKVKYVGPINAEDIPTERRKYSLLIRWDNRNNFLNPSSGYLFEVKPKLAGAFLGGNHHFIQLEASYSYYHRLFWDVVGATRIVSGVTNVLPQDTSGIVPADQRFYLGGNTSVRGYKNQMLGPIAGDKPLGGNFEVYGNFEVRFPVYWIIGGEVFLDWGNLWAEPKDANITDIKLAAGFGVTFATPIGPARIDFGKPLNDPLYGTSWNIHVAISHAF